MREIRSRDPNFEMIAFLRGVQRDVPKARRTPAFFLFSFFSLSPLPALPEITSRALDGNGNEKTCRSFSSSVSTIAINTHTTNFFLSLSFTFNFFLGSAQIIGAYLKGDVASLQQFCSPEMVERLSGIIEALKKEGHTPDATILHTSDVQLMEVKFMDR